MSFTTPASHTNPAQKHPAQSALDHQPYGCVKVNKAGCVLELNVAASALLGIRAADALGKCFFTQVAPSSGSAAFHGRFKAAMAGNGVLNKVLDHRFFLSDAPQPIRGVDVRVHMFSSVDATGLPIVWILTRKKSGAPQLGGLSRADDVQSEEAEQASDSVKALLTAKPRFRQRVQSISSEFGVSI